MKYGRSLVDLATELERQLATKQDMIVPTPLMHHVTSESGSSVLNIETGDGVRTFRTTENCRRQLADRLKIPYAYFERMRAEQPTLLDRNIDTWLHSQPEQRMVRTLDGNARAFLSDRYRRLDNYDLLAHVYPMLRELPGARVESCEVTDSRMYLKVVTSRVQFELQPGDVVHAGVVISNSETGQGSLSVSPLIFRLLCSNGLIDHPSPHRVGHLIAEARYAPFSRPGWADCALLVDVEFQGAGLGRLLSNALLRLASADGLAGLRGDVLEENHGMRALGRRLGATEWDSEDAEGQHILVLPCPPHRWLSRWLAGLRALRMTSTVAMGTVAGQAGP